MGTALAVLGETLTGTEENVWPECGQSVDDKRSSSGREVGRSSPRPVPILPPPAGSCSGSVLRDFTRCPWGGRIVQLHCVASLTAESRSEKHTGTGCDDGVREPLNPGPAVLEMEVTAVLCHTCPGCRGWWSSPRLCRPQRSEWSEKGQAGAADLPYGFCHPKMLFFFFFFSPP